MVKVESSLRAHNTIEKKSFDSFLDHRNVPGIAISFGFEGDFLLVQFALVSNSFPLGCHQMREENWISRVSSHITRFNLKSYLPFAPQIPGPSNPLEGTQHLDIPIYPR